MSGTIDLVRAYVALYTSRDREAFAERLAPGFTFTSPYDDHIDEAAYFERCWPGGDTVEQFDVEAMAADGERVFMRYLAKWPGKPAFRNVEVIAISDGRIASVEVYFGSGAS